MGKQEEIRNMEEFYKKYLPEYGEKYPISMRVSKEEGDYIRWRRGEWPLEKR